MGDLWEVCGDLWDSIYQRGNLFEGLWEVCGRSVGLHMLKKESFGRSVGSVGLPILNKLKVCGVCGTPYAIKIMLLKVCGVCGTDITKKNEADY